MALYQLTSRAPIKRTSDGAIIPVDPSNIDYQGYLAWVSEGNTPDPAPIPPALPPPSTISTWDFLNRLTAAEQSSVQTACSASLLLQVGLTRALAAGTVTLTSPEVIAWMGGMVTAGAITADRSTTLLTP